MISKYIAIIAFVVFLSAVGVKPASAQASNVVPITVVLAENMPAEVRVATMRRLTEPRNVVILNAQIATMKELSYGIRALLAEEANDRNGTGRSDAQRWLSRRADDAPVYPWAAAFLAKLQEAEIRPLSIGVSGRTRIARAIVPNVDKQRPQ